VILECQWIGGILDEPDGSFVTSRYFLALGVAGLVMASCAACATAGRAPDRTSVDSAIRARTNRGIRVEGAATLPPDIKIEDGLTSEGGGLDRAME
jgi:hypothetical protein